MRINRERARNVDAWPPQIEICLRSSEVGCVGEEDLGTCIFHHLPSTRVLRSHQENMGNESREDGLRDGQNQE